MLMFVYISLWFEILLTESRLRGYAPNPSPKERVVKRLNSNYSLLIVR